MDAIGGHNVKWSKPGSETQTPHVFSHICKKYLKDNHMHKNKHNHTQNQV
jgi:hypothetical protein